MFPPNVREVIHSQLHKLAARDKVLFLPVCVRQGVCALMAKIVETPRISDVKL